MKLNKIFGMLALSLVLGTSAFAEEEGTYGKLTVGYAKGGVSSDFNYYNGYSYNDTLYYKGLEIMPAFGFQLPLFQDMPFSLSVEAQLPIVIGSGKKDYCENDTFAIEPCGICFFNWHFGKQFAEPLQKLVPYGGLGVGLPIQHVSYKYRYQDGSGIWRTYEQTSNEIGFKVNMTLGARYDFTREIGALAEWNHGFIGEYSYSFRIGGVYRS